MVFLKDSNVIAMSANPEEVAHMPMPFKSKKTIMYDLIVALICSLCSFNYLSDS